MPPRSGWSLAPSAPATLPPGWQKVDGPTGAYYWNKDTGQVEWTPPAMQDDVKAALKKMADAQKAAVFGGHAMIPLSLQADIAAECGDFWCEATKTCVPDWWTCGGLAGVRLAPVGKWRRPEPWIAPVAAFVVVLVGTCIGLSALRQRLAASCPGLFGDASGQPAPLSKGDEYT